MFNKAERIVALINKYLAGTINETEQYELDEWVSRSDENLALFQERVDEDRLVDDYMKDFQRVNYDAAWKRIEQAVQLKKTPLTIRWWRCAPTFAKASVGMAAVLLACCIGMVVYLHLCNRAETTNNPQFSQEQTIHDKPLPKINNADFKTENPLLIQVPHSQDNLLFTNENVRGVANKIARQYDLEVEFVAPLAHNIEVSGIMPGNQDMASVISVLEFLYDKEMYFEYTGKKIRILPACKKC